ncbi:MAG: hypothetical protein KME63_02190 [Candidatus Thiodiazotropha sp. (ex Clathrolucina costata)]|nr:hypothetical protein [Candidatus Thiodiazotropha taylori]MBT3031775.1 hypothetical protein [Candidatus Thiodiazotropha sp. (ex Lucina pensylvanica)]MBT3049774.1 hypothetical protein [Candidatus Thiodiazotropha sp. (ex Codakia orbicularis)]MCG7862828.1 hypothetical protein [Candidatus Thiodiazotropha endolucinida]
MDSEREGLIRHIVSVINRRKEVAEILSSSLAIPLGKLFYTWIRLEIEQDGNLGNGWRYFFHGLDCTLNNKKTGESIRLEFGPGGRVDSFTKSVLVDMKDSDLYYPEENSGELFDALCEEGYVDYAEPEFHQKVSTLLDKGALDPYMNTLSDERQMDVMVSDRLVLRVSQDSH